MRRCLPTLTRPARPGALCDACGRPGIVDLGIHLTRADGTAVYRYLPKQIGDRTVSWLKDGIKSGYSDDVRLTCRAT